jgi:hypothetical protein
MGIYNRKNAIGISNKVLNQFFTILVLRHFTGNKNGKWQRQWCKQLSKRTANPNLHH